MDGRGGRRRLQRLHKIPLIVEVEMWTRMLKELTSTLTNVLRFFRLILDVAVKDLCMLKEFSVGTVSNSTEGGAVPIPDIDDAFFVPDSKLPEEGGFVDENEVCVFSGAFRKSSAVVHDNDGNTMFLPLPLASSNGCQTTTKNFQLVVKGTVSEGEDGREQIELEFSDDYGESYYTDDKECPLSYVARKVNDDEMSRARTRALAPRSIGQGHRSLSDVIGDVLYGGVLVVAVSMGVAEKAIKCAYSFLFCPGALDILT